MESTPRPSDRPPGMLSRARVPGFVASCYFGAALVWIVSTIGVGESLFPEPARQLAFDHIEDTVLAALTSLLIFYLLYVHRTSAHAEAGPGRATRLSMSDLLVLLVSASTLPMVAIIAYDMRSDAERRAAEMEQVLERTTAFSAAETASLFREFDSTAALVRGRQMSEVLRTGMCDPLLPDLVASQPALLDIEVMRGRGERACWALPPPAGVTAASMPGEAGRRGIAGPQRYGKGPWAIDVAYALAPSRSGAGASAGTIRLFIDLGRFQFTVPQELPPGSIVGLMDGSGLLLARSPQAQEFVGRRVPDAQLVRSLGGAQSGRDLGRGADGVLRIYRWQRVAGTGWFAFTAVPFDPIYSVARDRLLVHLGIAGAVLVAVVALMLFVGSLMIKPIRALARAAAQAEPGGDQPAAAVAGPMEVARLAEAFNRMIERLRSAHLELERNNATLESRVGERTAELQRANEALESFSSLVAHDLRAPVAAVGGFSRAMSAALDVRDEDRVRHYAKRIAANSKLMGSLIDGLLELAHVNRQERLDSDVDMGALVEEVLAETDAREKAEVQVQPMPVVRGDATLLRQVWRNLVSNALKYSSRCEHPRVAIRFEPGAAENVFTVEDNGIGFDAQEAKQLFKSFYRLDGSLGFEGTGLGLMVVKSIVERHGGRAWAEGRPGAGAAFRFTLPHG